MVFSCALPSQITCCHSFISNFFPLLANSLPEEMTQITINKIWCTVNFSAEYSFALSINRANVWRNKKKENFMQAQKIHLNWTRCGINDRFYVCVFMLCWYFSSSAARFFAAYFILLLVICMVPIKSAMSLLTDFSVIFDFYASLLGLYRENIWAKKRGTRARSRSHTFTTIKLTTEN